jgi:hypothetical protein
VGRMTVEPASRPFPKTASWCIAVVSDQFNYLGTIGKAPGRRLLGNLEYMARLTSRQMNDDWR